MTHRQGTVARVAAVWAAAAALMAANWIWGPFPGTGFWERYGWSIGLLTGFLLGWAVRGMRSREGSTR